MSFHHSVLIPTEFHHLDVIPPFWCHSNKFYHSDVIPSFWCHSIISVSFGCHSIIWMPSFQYHTNHRVILNAFYHSHFILMLFHNFEIILINFVILNSFISHSSSFWTRMYCPNVLKISHSRPSPLRNGLIIPPPLFPVDVICEQPHTKMTKISKWLKTLSFIKTLRMEIAF